MGEIANQAFPQIKIPQDVQSLGQQAFESQVEPFRRGHEKRLEGTIENLSRRGVQFGGVGDKNISNLLEAEANVEANIAKTIGSNLGMTLLDQSFRSSEAAQRFEEQKSLSELGFSQQKELIGMEQKNQLLNDQFDLVQSGQITGEQSKQILQEKGIDPLEFATPEQVLQARESEAFNKLLSETITDPEVASNISNQAELDFYLREGKTYEDTVADIVDKSGSFEEWNARRPELQDSLTAARESLRHENAKWLPWEHDAKYAERLKQQIAALEEALALLDMGQAPGSETEATLESL